MAAMPPGSGAPKKKKKSSKGNAELSFSLPSTSEDDERQSSVSKADNIGKLIFQSDDNSLGVYLKDLVSAAGLKDAWAIMTKKMRHVEVEHAHLIAFASREALNKDYVTRPEYTAKVELEYSAIFEDHTHRIIQVEKQASEATKERERLEQKIDSVADKLDDEIKFLRPELKAAQDHVKRVEEVSDARHAVTLQAIQNLQTDITDRETALRKELKALEGRLLREEATREVLGMEVARQKDFLAGPTLKKHIVDTCAVALADYVNKDEMLTEVQRSTDHMVTPLRHEFEALGKDVQLHVDELRMKDAYLEQCQDNFAQLSTKCDQELSQRIDALKEEVDTKAAILWVENIQGELSFRLRETNKEMERLEKDTLRKMQELATRVTEFQVILEDHEHALQHSAEEILNRATKYEVAICVERLDKCALRDKVEADIQDIRHTLSWTSTKVEAMAYDSSFGGGGSPSASSRKLGRTRNRLTPSASKMSFRSGKATSRSNSVVSRSLTATLAEARAESQASSGDRTPKPDQETSFQRGTSQDRDNSLDVSGEIPESKEQSGLEGNVEELDTTTVEGQNAAAEACEDEDDNASVEEGRGLGDGLLQQHELMQAFQEQIQELQMQFEEGPPVGASGIITMIQQQLECLSKALMGIARACLKPLPGNNRPTAFSEVPGLQGLAREPRMDHCSELLHHVNSVMYWVINSKRPADWVPDQLTTCALRALPPPGADNFASKATPTKPEGSAPKTKRLQRLRPKAGKLREASEELASLSLSPRSTGRAFASGGVGWRGRAIPASGQFPSTETTKRPATSGVSTEVSSLPPATGSGLNLRGMAPETPRVDTAPPGRRNLAPRITPTMENMSLEFPSVAEELSLPQLSVTGCGSGPKAQSCSRSPAVTPSPSLEG
eukprot:TRINITY_DN22598_c0_g1_i1.p1 TRINITY_DN22598_c0_g1~~TRINITY_DN22598_c0_g1_i1.p1  ORF type:complete len:900 (+),score=188.39 TRINITY_DN22598_c0_g1_i1:94-2793(+)